jgi:hypothetical protein
MVGAVTEEEVLALERCLDALQSHVADPVVTRQLVGLGGARLQCRVFPGHGSASLGGVGESEGPRVPTGARVAAVVFAMRSSLTVACLAAQRGDASLTHRASSVRVRVGSCR